MNTHLVSVKIGWDDPSPVDLAELQEKINEYICPAWKLSNLRIVGKYLNSDIETSLPFEYRDESYVQGLISGFLMAKGYEVI